MKTGEVKTICPTEETLIKVKCLDYGVFEVTKCVNASEQHPQMEFKIVLTEKEIVKICDEAEWG